MSFSEVIPTGSPITPWSAPRQIRSPSLPDICSANGKRMAATSTNTAWAQPTSSDFFAYISARYQVRKETYHGANGDIALEVYYDPAHTYDVDDMLASSRAGLDYYQTRLQSLPVQSVPHLSNFLVTAPLPSRSPTLSRTPRPSALSAASRSRPTSTSLTSSTRMNSATNGGRIS